jgi:hypothetical protein
MRPRGRPGPASLACRGAVRTKRVKCGKCAACWLMALFVCYRIRDQSVAKCAYQTRANCVVKCSRKKRQDGSGGKASRWESKERQTQTREQLSKSSNM